MGIPVPPKPVFFMTISWALMGHAIARALVATAYQSNFILPRLEKTISASRNYRSDPKNEFSRAG